MSSPEPVRRCSSARRSPGTPAVSTRNWIGSRTRSSVSASSSRGNSPVSTTFSSTVTIPVTHQPTSLKTRAGSISRRTKTRSNASRTRGTTFARATNSSSRSDTSQRDDSCEGRGTCGTPPRRRGRTPVSAGSPAPGFDGDRFRSFSLSDSCSSHSYSVSAHVLGERARSRPIVLIRNERSVRVLSTRTIAEPKRFRFHRLSHL